MIEVLSETKDNNYKNIRQDKIVTLDEFSKQIWESSYKADQDVTIFDTWNRIATHAAYVECSEELREHWKIKFYELLYDFGFVPGGRIIANLGVSELKETTLMNCFVHSPLDLNIDSVDSIEGIYELLKAQAHTLKSEGGYGMNFSWLRPAGTYIKGIGSRTPGVLSFMDLWNLSSKVITSGYDGEIFGKRYKNEKNKIRKGAQMGMLNVWHPDIEPFITAKQAANRFDKFNLSVVITSGFMEAVKNDDTWELIFPDTDFEKYDTEWDGNIEHWKEKQYPIIVYKTIQAKELWEKIMLSTYNRNEPGIFFSDVTNKLNPLYYAETVVTTNPCITGDTLVAVADGRNIVSIKELAEKGDDVPVYCLNNNGKVVIRMMRHPRITGYNEKIYKITLDDGNTIKTTGNHKLLLKSGKYIEVSKLKPGDSLDMMIKYHGNIKDVFSGESSNSQDYMWYQKSNLKTPHFEHRLIYSFYKNIDIPYGHIIHHRNYNGLDNNINNLEMMNKKDHDILHSLDRMGEKNPYHRMTDEWKFRFASHPQENNPKYCGYTEAEIREHAIKLTKLLGRRFSNNEWINYAKQHSLPQHFSSWRNSQLGTIFKLSKWAVNKLKINDMCIKDHRLLRKYYKLLEMGYDLKVKNNTFIVRKNCAICKCHIELDHNRYEVSICNSNECFTAHSKNKFKEKISERHIKLQNEQINVFLDLKFNSTTVIKKDWVLECKKRGISSEISRKSSPFQSWNELKEAASNYNHRIVSVEVIGTDVVYNGTVDEFHNFYIGGFETTTALDKPKWLFFNNLNCGEIPMSTGVCNLGSLNLTKFIKISELGDVEFDFDSFADAVQIAVRFLDNINDISNAPLKVYKDSMLEKRRIGLGVLGLGSLHFMLGMEYGSSESLYFIKKLYKCKAYNELLASAKLGQEKGSFELFDHDKYFNSYWWDNLDILPDEKQYIESFGAMRNSHRSMSAPTGQTSVFAEQVSSGIEPVFFKEYYRWVICSDEERRKFRQSGFNFPNINNNEFYETEHLKYSQRGDETILSGEFNGEAFEYDKNRGLVKRSLVEDYGWKWIKEHNFINPNMQYKTAEELSIDEHIKPLEIIAHYTDQAVSKTVNVETTYPYESFKELYFKAWNAGIKGITTYRAGTMTAVIEDVKKVQEYQNELEKLFKENPGVILENVKLPKQYFSKGHIIKDNHRKKWYVNIAFADSEYKHPFAIFVTTNNKESNEVTEDLISDVISLCRVKGIKQEFIDDLIHKYTGQTNISKISRALGMCLRHNIPLIEIVNLLEVYTVEISSFLFHLKKLLSTYIDNGTVIDSEECPNCGPNTIIFQDGCISCKNCGYARC